MDFELGKGFSAEGTYGTVDLSRQPDELVLKALHEAHDIARNRNLLTENEAEEFSDLPAQPEAQPDQREQLLGSLTEGVKLYRGVIESINQGRSEEDQITVLTDEEYQKQAEAWLSSERLEAARQLPQIAERPLLMVPRLNRAITHEEILQAWAAASDNGLYKWSAQLDFLKQFPADKLSGYDPSLGEEAGFVILPTDYDEEREGTVQTQTDQLEVLQSKHAELEVASILDGAILAGRYKGQPRIWHDSYVKQIDADPTKVDRHDFVVDAVVDDNDKAYVDRSSVWDDYAARLRVR